MANYISAYTGTEIDTAIDKVQSITASAAELNYVDGVTSNIQTQLDAKADQNATVETKSANYTLVAGDNNKIIQVDTTCTITLPDGLDTGFQVVIVNIGSSVTVTLSADTTLQTKDSAVTITSQYGAITAYHAGSNVWRAFGDLS